MEGHLPRSDDRPAWEALGEDPLFRHALEHPILTTHGIVTRIFNPHFMGRGGVVHFEPGIGTQTDSPDGRLLVRALCEVIEHPIVTTDSRWFSPHGLVGDARNRLTIFRELGIEHVRAVGVSAGALRSLVMGQEDAATRILQSIDTYSLPLQTKILHRDRAKRFLELLAFYFDEAVDTIDLPPGVLMEKQLYRSYYGKDPLSNPRAIHAFKAFVNSIKPGLADDLSLQDMNPRKIISMFMRGWGIVDASDPESVKKLRQGLRLRMVVGEKDRFTNFQDHIDAADIRNNAHPGSCTVEILTDEGHSYLRDHRLLAKRIAAGLSEAA